MPGYVHIYCGNGKGKTTAAVGLSLRAAGRGKKVLIARFMKTDDSGEVEILKQIPGIEVIPCSRTFGFYNQMSEQQKKEAGEYYRELLELAFKRAGEECFDLLVLDEIMAACHYRFADDSRLITLIKQRCLELEVIMTGRNPSEGLILCADYLSEIRALRHPYDQGVAAREGIEY